MGWIRRHWRALLGVVALIHPLFKWVGWFISRGGDADFIISRSNEPGWVGKMINWIINPPDWTTMPLILVGLGLIWLDMARRRPAKEPIVLSPPPPIVEAPAIDASETPKPRVPTPEIKAPETPLREFVDARVTPAILVGLYKGNTALRAETLISDYIGKWMFVSGPLGEIHPGMEFFSRARSPSLVVFSVSEEPYIYMWFSNDWTDRLALLPQEQQISVCGQIEKIEPHRMELRNCELIGPSNEGSAHSH